ncbi:MAG: hypothetical protein KF782_21845 [Labilithrix sp.]|nr:hypothetical protein [Labilithrix sp.]
MNEGPLDRVSSSRDVQLPSLHGVEAHRVDAHGVDVDAHGVDARGVDVDAHGVDARTLTGERAAARPRALAGVVLERFRGAGRAG